MVRRKRHVSSSQRKADDSGLKLYEPNHGGWVAIGDLRTLTLEATTPMPDSKGIGVSCLLWQSAGVNSSLERGDS